MTDNILRGIDQIFNNAGDQIAPLGFGFDSDWETLARHEISDDSELTFTWDETLYDEVEFSIMSLVPATDGANLLMTISDDGGATYETGASYDRSLRFINDVETAGSGSVSTGQTSINVAPVMGGAADEFFSGNLKIYDPGNTTEFKGIIGQTIQILDTGSVASATLGAMWRGSDNAINGARFAASSGNLESGTFVLRGRRKAHRSFVAQDDWAVIEDITDVSAVTTHDIFWADDLYDEIEISAWGVVIGTDNQDILGLVSTDGSTFLNGTGDYRYTVQASNSNGDDGNHESASATSLVLGTNLGTGTDEDMDFVVHLRNVSNATRKKKVTWRGTGILQDTFLYDQIGAGIILDNDNSLRGFRFDGEGATTFSADRIRVRGRRLAPIGANAVPSNVFLGEFTVATGGDAFIDVDMRSSVNPQFANFKNNDYEVVVYGQTGPSNAAASLVLLQDGVPLTTAGSYKQDNAGSVAEVRMSNGTGGANRTFIAKFVITGINRDNATTERFTLTGDAYTVSSGGGALNLACAGTINGTPLLTDNGFRMQLSAGDMDDMRVRVWALSPTT